MPDVGILSLVENPVSVAIVLLATSIYGFLLQLCFLLPADSHWASKVKSSKTSRKVLIAALPLLGLLGTINGLMSTFSALSINAAADLEVLMTSGISDALVTTQLGLSFAVPALVLQAVLNRRYRQYTSERYILEVLR